VDTQTKADEADQEFGIAKDAAKDINDEFKKTGNGEQESETARRDRSAASDAAAVAKQFAKAARTIADALAQRQRAIDDFEKQRDDKA
jgi:hypothetical protein